MTSAAKPFDVFVSYSTADKAMADAACGVLERHRLRCWMAPRDILPGKEWQEEIIRGIDGSRVMLLVFSAAANGSPQVRREVERAIHKGLAVLPFRVADVRPSGAMEFALSNTHWLDAFTPPVERHLDKLAEAIHGLLAASGGVDAHRTTPAIDPPAASRPRRRWLWPVVAAGVLFGAISTVALAGGLLRRNPTGGAPNDTRVAAADEVVRPAVSTPPTPTAKPTQTDLKRAGPPTGSPSVPPGGQFVSLFNGRDLTGWEQRGVTGVKWDVVNGMMVGQRPAGTAGLASLATTRANFRHFHLRVEAQIPTSGLNAVFLFPGRGERGPAGRFRIAMCGPDAGDECSVGQLSCSSTFVAPPLSTPVAPPGGWVTLEAIVVGNRLTVLADGRPTADVVANGLTEAGYCIKIGMGSLSDTLRVRSVMVRDLNPATADPPPPNLPVAPAPPAVTPRLVSSEFAKGQTEGWTTAALTGAGGVTGPVTTNNFGEQYWIQATSRPKQPAWYWVAPDKFHGDHSAKAGQLLYFAQHSAKAVTPETAVPGPFVVIRGRRQELMVRWQDIRPRLNQWGWNEYRARLDTTTPWQLTADGRTTLATTADIARVLADVTGLFIRGVPIADSTLGEIDTIKLGATD